MKRVRVLVIDNSAYNRKAIADMLRKSSDIEVVAAATNGEEGLEKALTLKPDVATLDLNLPVMDGFSFLEIIMERMPLPVVVVSSRSYDADVIRALELGAVDFIAKPTARVSREILNIEEDLISKVRMISGLKMNNLKKWVDGHDLSGKKVKHAKVGDVIKGRFNVVAIGASTGGPPALESIFSSLPGDLHLAFVVSQHMPQGFTGAFARRLDRLSELEVKEAADGDGLVSGRVLIAPGGSHMIFVKAKDVVKVKIVERASEDIYAPSVDMMFSSIAENFGDKAAGVVLTGMGKDGSIGVQDIKRSGGIVIVESEETSIVYGMPKEVIKTGVVDDILPLDRIPTEIVRLDVG